jgi:hypothetical protein
MGIHRSGVGRLPLHRECPRRCGAVRSAAICPGLPALIGIALPANHWRLGRPLNHVRCVPRSHSVDVWRDGVLGLASLLSHRLRPRRGTMVHPPEKEERKRMKALSSGLRSEPQITELPNNGLQLTKAARCAPFAFRSWGQSLRAAFAAEPGCSAGSRGRG